MLLLRGIPSVLFPIYPWCMTLGIFGAVEAYKYLNFTQPLLMVGIFPVCAAGVFVTALIPSYILFRRRDLSQDLGPFTKGFPKLLVSQKRYPFVFTMVVGYALLSVVTYFVLGWEGAALGFLGSVLFVPFTLFGAR